MSSKKIAHVWDSKWRSQDVQLFEDADFSSLLLPERLLKGLKKAGFRKPSPIQLEAIPIGRFGKDLLVQAKSGTGKTLVFTIIALEILKQKLFCPQVLILAPTREIASQICSVIKSVASTYSKLTCHCFIGGLPLAEDKENVSNSQIVVGTPGRIKQLIHLKVLHTSSIRLFVMDEVDKLLQESFQSDVESIFSFLPTDKQVIATSATYPSKIRSLLMNFLREPFIASLASKQLSLLGMVHYTKVVKSNPVSFLVYKSKLEILERILNTLKFAQCLVFCNMVARVDILCKSIKSWGFSTTYISSAKEQTERLKAIDHLKHFRCKVLVSSDLTARGIDAENVDLVINFDLPAKAETYLHRVGRAGRYGSVGLSVSLINEKELYVMKEIETVSGFKSYKLPDDLPADLITNNYFGECTFEDDVEEIAKSSEGINPEVPIGTNSDCEKSTLHGLFNEKNKEPSNSSPDVNFKDSEYTNTLSLTLDESVNGNTSQIVKREHLKCENGKTNASECSEVQDLYQKSEDVQKRNSEKNLADKDDEMNDCGKCRESSVEGSEWESILNDAQSNSLASFKSFSNGSVIHDSNACKTKYDSLTEESMSSFIYSSTENTSEINSNSPFREFTTTVIPLSKKKSSKVKHNTSVEESAPVTICSSEKDVLEVKSNPTVKESVSAVIKHETTACVAKVISESNKSATFKSEIIPEVSGSGLSNGNKMYENGDILCNPDSRKFESSSEGNNFTSDISKVNYKSDVENAACDADTIERSAIVDLSAVAKNIAMAYEKKCSSGDSQFYSVKDAICNSDNEYMSADNLQRIAIERIDFFYEVFKNFQRESNADVMIVKSSEENHLQPSQSNVCSSEVSKKFLPEYRENVDLVNDVVGTTADTSTLQNKNPEVSRENVSDLKSDKATPKCFVENEGSVQKSSERSLNVSNIISGSKNIKKNKLSDEERLQNFFNTRFVGDSDSDHSSSSSLPVFDSNKNQDSESSSRLSSVSFADSEGHSSGLSSDDSDNSVCSGAKVKQSRHIEMGNSPKLRHESKTQFRNKTVRKNSCNEQNRFQSVNRCVCCKCVQNCVTSAAAYNHKQHSHVKKCIHGPNCYVPSKDTTDAYATQNACVMWHNVFYNQWLHIQNCLKFS